MRTKKTTYKIESFPDGSIADYLYAEEMLNEKGKILSSVYYTSDGTVLEHYRNEYDSNDRTLKTESFDADGELIQRDTFVYENDNDITSIVQTIDQSDGSTDRYVESYRGSYLLKSEFYRGDVLMEIEKNIYDNGRLTKHLISDARGNELQKETYLFDGDSLVIEKYMNGELVQTETCLLDGENIIEESFVSDGVQNRTLFKYDNHNNMIEETEYRDGMPVMTRFCKYEGTLLVEELVEDFAAKRAISRKSIEYDTKGRKILEKDQYNHMRYCYEDLE